QVRLNDNRTVVIMTSSHSANKLVHQLECTLLGSKIWDRKVGIRIDKTYDRKIGQVKALGKHLCAYQYVYLAKVNIFIELVEALTLQIVGVKAGNPGRREQTFNTCFNRFSTDTF